MNYHPSLMSLSLGVTAALIAASPVRSAQFPDVAPDHWAYNYIERLAERQMINGYEDGRFHPTDVVTRSQFATIVRSAFLAAEPVPELALEGVPLDYWAYDALAIARVHGFLPGGLDAPVQPDQVMTRGDALAALVNGLGYASDGVDLTYYIDAEQIPASLRPAIAAATQAQIVVGHPDANWLHGDRPVTRMEVAAFVYQALVQEGRAEPLAATPHVANSPDVPWSGQPITIISETTRQIRLSRWGTRLATLNLAGDTIRIWNGRTAATVTEISADSATRFHAIAVSHDGVKVAAIVETVPDNTLALALWDSETGRQRWQRSLGTVRGRSRLDDYVRPELAFHPEDMAILSQVYLQGGPDDRSEQLQLQLHDAATGDRVQSFEPTSTSAYRQFAFSPDGAWLAIQGLGSTEAKPGQNSAEVVIDIWQVETGTRDRTLRPIGEDYFSVNMVFTAADSLRVLSQSFSSSSTDSRLTHIETWNVETGEQSEPTTALSLTYLDWLIRPSPDGEHYLVRGSGPGYIKNIPQETVTRLESYPPPDYELGLLYGYPEAIFDATGHYLAISAHGNVYIFTRR
ncbi:MAG: S-layer homology domain-containing protein [Cyanobacteria bacterium P01_C01_bin.73]